MKVLCEPRTRKIGQNVYYLSPYGQCARIYCCPSSPRTQAQERVWSFVAFFSRAWAARLTQEQRDRWNVAGGKAPTRKRLGKSYWQTGEQFFVGTNAARACIGQPPLWEPPDPVVFGPNVVGQLAIVDTDQGLRLLLNLTGPVTEDIMVFGQAPCSQGRSKRRNVAYLGLLPPTKDGVCDITDIYVAKYGPLRPGTRIFIVTRQQKDGWEGPDKQTDDVVPSTREPQQPTAEPTVSLKPNMYEGCTRGPKRLVLSCESS